MNDNAKRREFMTLWHNSSRNYLATWSIRNKADLTGGGTSTRYVPMFRPFDLLEKPNQQLVLLECEDHRIGVESVCGPQENFRRNVDFDTVYVQFAGHSTIETEYGEYSLAPGELLLIPEGISHRSCGTGNSLRWFAWVVEPFTEVMSDSDHTSETSFTVTRIGGPTWSAPPWNQAERIGRVREQMFCWDDGPDDRTIVERNYDSEFEVSSTSSREKISGIRKLRIFDTFRDIAGTSGEPPALMRSKYLELKTYNIVGEQFAFHRALRSEEVRIQFRGKALDMSELGSNAIQPGDVTIIPRGIAHSVVTDPLDDRSFLRLNFYSNLRWRYPNDLRTHFFETHFETKADVRKPPKWAAAAE